jgi:hypothetical protein
MITSRYGGMVPDELEELLSLLEWAGRPATVSWYMASGNPRYPWIHTYMGYQIGFGWSKQILQKKLRENFKRRFHGNCGARLTGSS